LGEWYDSIPGVLLVLVARKKREIASVSALSAGSPLSLLGLSLGAIRRAKIESVKGASDAGRGRNHNEVSVKGRS